jgi:methyltransferase (TIGR00027 family)
VSRFFEGSPVQEDRVSITALMTAYARAYHATHDTPKIFDDFLAGEFLTEKGQAWLGARLVEILPLLNPELAASHPDQATALAWVMQNQTASTTISRARYAEDALVSAVQGGVRQYILLGAGMDTFAFRRPEMMEQLAVFEVDHPATQAFKRGRLAELQWELPPRLHFIPVDFSKDSLAAALCGSSHEPAQTSFVSWLGVTYYLTREVVLSTLRSIAALAGPGGTVVFDYLHPDAFSPERTSKRTQWTLEAVRRAGEPMKTGFDPSALAGDLESCGWRLQENLSPSDIQKRYFAGRTDGYHASPHIHFAQAMIERSS